MQLVLNPKKVVKGNYTTKHTIEFMLYGCKGYVILYLKPS